MDEKGIVIEACFNPPDGSPFITIEGFCSLDNFRVGASFRIGEVAVEKTEEGVKAVATKNRVTFQLREIGSHTKALMLVKENYSLSQIRPGNFMECI